VAREVSREVCQNHGNPLENLPRRRDRDMPGQMLPAFRLRNESAPWSMYCGGATMVREAPEVGVYNYIPLMYVPL
jgi:hypothetical protein